MILFQATVLIFVLKSVNGNDEKCSKNGNSSISKLKADLFCDYKNKNRPVISHKNATQIYLTLHVSYVTYDFHQSKLIVNNWLEMHWNDSNLKWNPKDYDSIEKLSLSEENIWTPDLSIYNKHSPSENQKAIDSAKCMVKYNGQIQCMAPSQHDGLCWPELEWYPFDSQTCQIVYGSWSHRGEEINVSLNIPPVMLDTYKSNPEWRLMTITAKRNPGLFGNVSYPSLTFIFDLKRNTAIYTATIVVPAVVLVLLTWSTLLMDFRSNERINLASLNLICHILYIHHICWSIPMGDTKPMIVIFFRDSTIFCSIIIVITIFCKKIIEIKTSCPTFISWILSTCFVQIIVSRTYSIEKAASVKQTDEDGQTILDIKQTEFDENWIILASFLHRILIATYVLAYIILYFKYIP